MDRLVHRTTLMSKKKKVGYLTFRKCPTIPYLVCTFVIGAFPTSFALSGIAIVLPEVGVLVIRVFSFDDLGDRLHGSSGRFGRGRGPRDLL
jgi:hypothetical protein